MGSPDDNLFNIDVCPPYERGGEARELKRKEIDRKGSISISSRVTGDEGPQFPAFFVFP
jgi:hypothetical protein